MTEQEIKNNFTYHTPTEDMPKKFETLRNKAKELAFLIEELVPDGREKSLAHTKLQEVIMWANAGIVIPKQEKKTLDNNRPEYVNIPINPACDSQHEIKQIIEVQEDKGYKLLKMEYDIMANCDVLRFKRKD